MGDKTFVPTMVAEWLQNHGYDGLCHPETECGCALDDFMPCGEPRTDCEPGYKVPRHGRLFIISNVKPKEAE